MDNLSVGTDERKGGRCMKDPTSVGDTFEGTERKGESCRGTSGADTTVTILLWGRNYWGARDRVVHPKTTS